MRAGIRLVGMARLEAAEPGEGDDDPSVIVPSVIVPQSPAW